MTPDAEKAIPRDLPDVPDDRAALVKDWSKRVTEAKEYWRPVFERMRKNMRLAKGWQWGQMSADEKDDRYVCNLIHRHIRQRVSALYAKNPRVIAKRRPRLDFKIWDGDPESIMAAQTLLSAASQPAMVDPMTGAPMPAPMIDPAALGQAQALVADYQEGMARRKMIERTGKTLETLFQHFMLEGTPPFKTKLKQLVVRVLTCKVGYIKLGFQREMERSPDLEGKIKDVTEHLAKLEALAADVADGEIYEGEKEMEELRLSLAALQQKMDVVVREGLVFDFPRATQLIPDPCMTNLKGFEGADWIAQEYLFTPQRVKQIWKVDVGKNFRGYDRAGQRKKRGQQASSMCCVWEIFDTTDGKKLTICDGYPDFLEEPAVPDVRLEQNHPFFALTFNDLEDEEDVFPPADVELIEPMQAQYNESREGLREHRQGSAPAWVTAGRPFGKEDKERLAFHVPHEVLELEGVPPGTKISDVLMAKPIAQIQPEVYDVEHLFTDTQRAIGDQAANFGGTSDATATEASIAEGTRVSSLSSNVDDLDDCLTQLARAGGQVMLQNMSVEQVAEIVGPGAVWPEFSADEIARELYLDIQAGSSGRPNKAQDLTNLERLAPFMIQMPGVKLKRLLQEFVSRLDDGLDVEEFYEPGGPSIVAQNAAMKPSTGDPATDPGQQGNKGATNEPQPRARPGPKPNLVAMNSATANPVGG